MTPTSFSRQFSDEKLTTEAIKKMLQRNGANDLDRLVAGLPSLHQTACEIAEYKAGEKRKDVHRHLFLPRGFNRKDGVAVSSAHYPREVQQILDPLWFACGGVTELKIYPYTPRGN